MTSGPAFCSAPSTLDLSDVEEMSVLLVDDDEDDALFVRDLLEEMGEPAWVLEWRWSIEGGLNALASGRYGVCLVDYRLGRQSGVELLERAKTVAPNVPIILLTGENRREVDIAAMRAGAVDFLAKDRLDSLTLERALRYALERRRAAAELVRLARRDPLTGLHNRASLAERIDGAIARTVRAGTIFAVVMTDLDGFKRVNDGFGHDVGDELLRIIAARLRQAVRPYDTVGRIGGDEFVVLLENLETPEEGIAIAERLCRAIQPPYEVDVPLPPVTASVGVAFYPKAGTDAQTILRSADAAMYAAKRSGKGRVVISEGGAAHGAVPLDLDELKSALARGDFGLAFQPQVDIGTGRPLGFEVLARWRGGARSIAEVVAELEATGAIVELDLWVLERAVAMLATNAWASRISVNLSARTLETPDILQRIADRLPEDPSRIELEVTESIDIEEPARVADQLHVLRAMGIRIALDDFGVGHSTFERLLQLPVDTVKVDRALVSHIAEDERSEAAVEAVLSFCRRARVDVVVEGVETQAQESALRRLGATFAQGYRYARPLDDAGLERWFLALAA